PTAAKRWQAAIMVPQTSSPATCLQGSLLNAVSFGSSAVTRLSPCVESQESARSIIAIWDGTRKIAPTEAAGVGAGEGMALGVLAREEPVETLGAEECGDIFARAGEGVDGERGIPSGKVGVYRPRAVGADRIDEEFAAFTAYLRGNRAFDFGL